MYGNNDWLEYLAHSKKGSTWKNHKYLRKENGVYIYAKNVADSARDLADAGREAYNATKHYLKVDKLADDAQRTYEKGQKAEAKYRNNIDKNVEKRDKAASKPHLITETITSHDVNNKEIFSKSRGLSEATYQRNANKAAKNLSNQIRDNKVAKENAEKMNARKNDKKKVKDESVKKLASAGKKFVNSLFGKKN